MISEWTSSSLSEEQFWSGYLMAPRKLSTISLQTTYSDTFVVIGMCVLDMTLRWRHNGCDSVSNHQPHDCLLNCLFRRRSKKTSKLRVTGLCVGNSPGTGEFPAQMASNAENVSIWWRHHDMHGNHVTEAQVSCQYITQIKNIPWYFS